MTSSLSYEPQPRWGHTSVTIGDRVFMWGGRIDDFSVSAKKEVSVECVCGFVFQDVSRSSQFIHDMGIFRFAIAYDLRS